MLFSNPIIFICVLSIYIYDWKKKTHYCHLLLYSHMYTCIYTYTHSYTTINKNHVFFFNIELFQSLFLRTYAHKILPPFLPSSYIQCISWSCHFKICLPYLYYFLYVCLHEDLYKYLVGLLICHNQLTVHVPSDRQTYWLTVCTTAEHLLPIVSECV